MIKQILLLLIQLVAVTFVYENIYTESCEKLDYRSKDRCSEYKHQMSFCNEEGQFIFHRGRLRNESTCGCIFSRGYEFVIQPRHKCYCIPSEEDCSCFKRTVNNTDYQCPQNGTMNTSTSNNTTSPLPETNKSASLINDDTKGNTCRVQCFIYTLASFIIMNVILFLAYLYLKINRQRKNTSTHRYKSKVDDSTMATDVQIHQILPVIIPKLDEIVQHAHEIQTKEKEGLHDSEKNETQLQHQTERKYNQSESKNQKDHGLWHTYADLLNKIQLDKIVLDKLISKCILMIEDREEIIKPTTQYERNKALLEILIERPYDKIKDFEDVLEETDQYRCNSDVQDLVCRLHSIKNNAPNVNFQKQPINFNENVIRVQKNYQLIVHNTISTDIIDYLIEELTLQPEDGEEISASGLTGNERNRLLLGKLLFKDGNVYNKFLKALSKTSFNEIADEVSNTEVTEKDKILYQIGIQKFTERQEAKGKEVEDLKTRFKNLERITDKGKKLEKEDPVPSNIREQIKRRIEEWKERNKIFISTRAYKDVLAKITKYRCVTITGSSGSGKSAILRQVALSLYEENGYDILMISSPIEFQNYYTPGKKTLFVLDDFCGRFTADKRQIDNWISTIDVVQLVIADEFCKILVSCRLEVYRDAKFAEIAPFKSHECNINSEELCLTTKEKKTFLKSYFGLDDVELDILSSKNDLFPFLCKSYSTDNKGQQMNTYFNTPYDVYKGELDKFKIHALHKFCGLCLCILFNNQLKESYFSIQAQKFSTIVEYTCGHIGLDKGTSPNKLLEELNTLTDTFWIIKRDGYYKINHDKLFDYMAYYFGHMMTQCFIVHADSGFLRERFLWGKAIDTEERIVENVIYINDDFLPSYIDRMITDWKNGKVSDVFYNRNMRSPAFREEFLKGLNGIDAIRTTKFSNIKDVFREDFASGNTPLIISCVDGYVDLLNWLLDHKANVNETRTDGASGLYMACQNNYVNVVKMLLNNNADVDLCTEDGVSPLWIACYLHGNLQIISELLKKNANVNMYRYKKNNSTPLYMACQGNFISTVKELLKHGADPDICLNDGISPLLFACQKRYIEIVRLLIEYKANLDTEMRDGDNPLFSVSQMGFNDITKILLENGANCEKYLRSKEEIEKSLEGTSQSLEQEKQAWFDNVQKFGSQKTAAYVRSKSPDYVFSVFAGSSPLHAACFMGHIEITEMLIEKLSSVDIRKKDGTTPLYYACELGHSTIVRLLLEREADPNIRKDNQSSPFTIAEMNGHDDVLSLLYGKT